MEQNDKTKLAAAAEGSDDLNQLLDSCLDDFNKPMPNLAPQPSTATEAKRSEPSESSNLSKDWSAEFEQFADVMGNLMDKEGDLGDLKQWMGNLQANVPTDGNFAETFAGAIKELTEQAQSGPDASDDLANLLNRLDMGGESLPDTGELPEIMPFMQNMMQQLMSKDLLYPSIKQIVDEYPAWLADKGTSLKDEERKNYEKQFGLMKEVCAEFETGEAGGQGQFEKVLQLMQSIQACGNPPKELVSGTGPIDEDGNIQIPGMAEQCAVM